MTAGRYDKLVIEQGATLDVPITLENPVGTEWDVTGFAFRAKVRGAYSDAAALLTLDVIVDDAAAGELRLYAAASATAEMPIGDLPQGFYPAVWDLEMVEAPTATGKVWRLLEGKCKIKPEATK